MEVEVERTDTANGRLSCGFLFFCSGYYRYDRAFALEFPGAEDFSGRIIHPQFWPEDLDYSGQRVVVIGSGATAVTLVPAMARAGRARDDAPALAELRRVVAGPRRTRRSDYAASSGYGSAISSSVGATYSCNCSASSSAGGARSLMKKLIRRGIERELPPGYDIDTHFNPSYNPWDQRLCLVPDGDLFTAISEGRADIVTDRIDRFDATGIGLASATSWTPTSSSPRPDSTSSRSAVSGSRSTNDRSSSRPRWATRAWC